MHSRLRVLVASLLMVACDRGHTAALVATAPSDGSHVGMAALTGGTFAMGDPKGVRNDTVTVKPFLMDVTEVTADAYSACVRAGACTDEGLKCHVTATYGVAGQGRHPITCVDSYQATAYCKWVGSRVPTEEEWEWAARGQSRGTTYPWGNDAPAAQACWNRGSAPGTCAVGSYPAGDAPGGIHDLAGNVWEWTSSNYDARATSLAMRGGDYSYSDATSLAAAHRGGHGPAARDYFLGFRCVRSL